MALESMLALQKSIGQFRQRMYELAKRKGVSDPDVVKVSQQLDEKIIMLQKIMYKCESNHSN